MIQIQTNSRTKVPLDGEWGFLPDPMAAFGPQKRSRSVFQGLTPTEEDRAVEYDIDAMHPIQVPGDWNTQDAEWLNLETVGWYARRLVISDPEWESMRGQRHLLCFESVNYGIQVWVNGQEVGKAEYPFVPLAFEVTGALVQDLLICVRVDAARDAKRLPSEIYDWWNYGGLTGSVSLCAVPETVVTDCHFTVDVLDDEQVSGRIRVEVDGPNAETFEVDVELLELGAGWTVTGRGGKGEASYSIRRDTGLIPWSCETPQRYAGRATLKQDGVVVDQLELKVGFRKIECRGTSIYLNGEKLVLKGIAWHDERFGEAGGRTRGLDDCKELVLAAKALGANFARLAHYPHNEHTLELCDEHGLLVWDELPVYWKIRYDDPATRRLAEDLWTKLLRRDRQHPCVLIHCVANETTDASGKEAFMKRLRELADALNPGIPLGAAVTVPFVRSAYRLFERPDMLLDFCDVIGINEYGGWYSPPLDQMPTARIAGHPDKPTFISEFGAAGPSGVYGPIDQLWNENHQREVYLQQFEMFRERAEGLCGICPWVLKDFRSPMRQNGFQRQFNRKGLLSNIGSEKLAYRTVKEEYHHLSEHVQALDKNHPTPSIDPSAVT